MSIQLEYPNPILLDYELSKSKLFLEKPYSTKDEELNEYLLLIESYSSRLHFSGKYANGRADIFYKNLPPILPIEIDASLIEGTDYYNIVAEKFEKEGKHSFLEDGPELDLGFHLIDIVTNALISIDPIKDMEILNSEELSNSDIHFKPGYGFKAELLITTVKGKKIILRLQAGKADTSNNRYVEFYYGAYKIRQEYTVGYTDDPVYMIDKNGQALLDKHHEGYNYYANELKKGNFCSQSQLSQIASINSTKIVCQLKGVRQKKIFDNHS